MKVGVSTRPRHKVSTSFSPTPCMSSSGVLGARGRRRCRHRQERRGRLALGRLRTRGLGQGRSSRRRQRADFGAAWGAIFGSWLLGAHGPIGAAIAAYFWFESRKAPPLEEPLEELVNPELERRLSRASSTSA